MKEKKLIYAAACFVAAGLFALCFTLSTASTVQAAPKRQFVYHKGSYYYYNNYGKKVKGWYTSSAGARYYFDPVTGAAKPGFHRIKGKTYFFNSRGLMYKNRIIKYRGKRYYVDQNGYKRTGRVRIGRNWYAFDGRTGVQYRNAWFTDKDGSKYYAGNRYALVKGWYKPDSHYRYFSSSDGKMLTGWQNIGKYRYLFHTKTGVRYESRRYTAGNKKIYGFNRYGKMYKNCWFTMDGKTYYARSDGSLAKGWLNIGQNTYYLNSQGEKRTGWITYRKKKYYLTPSTGILKRDCWVDKAHYVGEDGAWIPNYREKEFKWPLEKKNKYITSYFGNRYAPTSGASTNHKGLDIAADYGDPIYAAADGKITMIQPYHGAAGNHIQITHANGVITEYMHQARFASNLKRGSRVKKGQIIGYVGSTGISTGPHLHFGVIVKGTHKDPLKYVDQPK